MTILPFFSSHYHYHSKNHINFGYFDLAQFWNNIVHLPLFVQNKKIERGEGEREEYGDLLFRLVARAMRGNVTVSEGQRWSEGGTEMDRRGIEREGCGDLLFHLVARATRII